MQQNQNQKTQNRKRYPKKSVLASAEIKTGIHTDILQEDLFSEPVLDASGRNVKLIHDRWVLFFDQNQTFLKELMALVNNSHTLRNVITNKVRMVLGDGFVPVQSEGVPFLQTIRQLIRKITATDTTIEQINDLIGSVNINNSTLEEVLEKVLFDYFAFGNSFIELVKGTKNGVPVVYMNHIPVYTVALEKQSNLGRSENIGVCSDWQNLSRQKENITILPMFPNFERVKGAERSVIHIKEYGAGFVYWGIPSNIAGRFWSEIEYRIPKYNINKFQNGFVPSAIVQFFGSMTQEEAKGMIDKFTQTFTDTGKNSKIYAQVLRDEKYKSNVQVLEDKSDGNYMDLQELASQAIITANQWTTSLAGVATAGKLGTNQQMQAELEYIQNVVIKPIRRKILQKVINPFIQLNSDARNGSFNGTMLDIANLNPLSLASMLDANNILTTNEKRKIFGFDALDDNQQNDLNNGNSNNID